MKTFFKFAQKPCLVELLGWLPRFLSRSGWSGNVGHSQRGTDDFLHTLGQREGKTTRKLSLTVPDPIVVVGNGRRSGVFIGRALRAHSSSHLHTCFAICARFTTAPLSDKRAVSQEPWWTPLSLILWKKRTSLSFFLPSFWPSSQGFQFWEIFIVEISGN